MLYLGSSRRAGFRRLATAGVILVLCFVSRAGVAQDTRTVTEPTIPPACTVLNAQKQDSGGTIGAEFEKTTDTARIQKAIDECKPGQAVELALGAAKGKTPANNAFLSGSLDLREGVTLLVDKGVTLYGSRDPKDYDMNPSGMAETLCGSMSAGNLPAATPSTGVPAPARIASPQGRGGGCRPLISITNVKNAAIMGDGTIDGRGDATLIGHDYSWWQMVRRASSSHMRSFNTRLIVARNADGFTLYRITLHNSPNFHVTVGGTNGFTAWGVHLLSPTVKGTDAPNTDGIDPGSSTNVTIAHSWIDNGDDNVAIKTGVTHMSVIDNHFYSGHGMSIGSETNTGVSFLLVDGLTEDHTTSGVRIKSNVTRGGSVHDLTYRNICMRDVPNAIAISPFYTGQTVEGFVDPGLTGNLIPDYKNITLQNIADTTPGIVLIAGIGADHITTVTLDGVVISGIKPDQVHSQFSHITITGRGTALRFGGNGVAVDGQTATSGSGLDRDVKDCEAKFVPMR